MSARSFNCMHATITGLEARDILMNKGEDGNFLLRPSSSGNEDLSLSIRRGEEVIHIKIQNRGEGYDLFGGEMFATLPQLVDYYSNGEGRFLLKEKSGNPILLNKPFPAQKYRSERWFHSNITSLEAEEELKRVGKEGIFLVRESQSKGEGHFVFSYFTSKKDVIHVTIMKELGGYSIGDGVNFGSLSDMIEYYRGHYMTVKYNHTNYSFKLEKSLIDGIVDLSKVDSKIEELEKGKTKSGFKEEFEFIQQFDNKDNNTMTAGQLSDNKIKNRYRNILPYDETRVKLKGNSNSSSDYINANYIKVNSMLPHVTKTFIATQGCVKSSYTDFWSMVWQEGVVFIVMTTELIENGKNKCYPYWPTDPDKPLLLDCYQGNMEVRLMKTCNQHKEFIIRTFHLYCKGKSHTVYHYHHTCWPDRCAPKDISGVVDYLLKINNHSQQLNLPSSVPWVVHCSAGIGRTGTCILIDILISHIYSKGLDSHVSILRLLILMRTQRAGLIQLDKQYTFVYKALQLFINNYYKKNEQTKMDESNIYDNDEVLDSNLTNSSVYQNL